MKCYVALSYYNGDKGITNYTIFITTKAGIKVDSLDIRESEFEEYNTLENDLKCVKTYLKKKYKVAISLKFIKASYDVIW